VRNNAYRNLVKKSEGKGQPREPRSRRKTHTKLDLKTNKEGVHWINLAQDRGNTVMNFAEASNAENFSDSFTRTLLNAVTSCSRHAALTLNSYHREREREK
jgi:hypothetical protein